MMAISRRSSRPKPDSLSPLDKDFHYIRAAVPARRHLAQDQTISLDVGKLMRLLFKLDCGRSVAVGALYYQRTYLSLFEGRPDREMHVRLLEEVRSEMAPLWGKRRVHVIPPAIDLSDPVHPRLPEIRFTAWLTCYQPIREPNAGSELVVVWFRNESSGEALEKVVDDAIRPLP